LSLTGFPYGKYVQREDVNQAIATQKNLVSELKILIQDTDSSIPTEEQDCMTCLAGDQ
jgi:hypothetical protein